jgi:predicted enzyme related to lactoylglutathione lyase
VSGDHEHDGKVTLGPVMLYSAKPRDVARFYAELAGLEGDDSKASVWMKTEHADVVIHGRDDRDSPAEVRAQSGFVVWFGVADVGAAYQRARKAGWLVGDTYGDYFFARDPDGRFVGIYGTEGHHHGHDH